MKWRDGDDYLAMYPALTRWVNQCIVCQRKGYKPDMPKSEFPNIPRYFPPLSVNDLGLCEQCASVQQGRNET